jgi:hypothetical protein
LGATILGPALLRWAFGSLKRVRMGDRALYISNYSREVSVPLTDVTQVTHSRWGHNIRALTIHFRSATRFGSSIDFVPKLRWGSRLGSPPVAQEIRAAVARASGQGPGGVAA